MPVTTSGLPPLARCLSVAALLMASTCPAWPGPPDAGRGALFTQSARDLPTRPILPDPARPETLCDAAVQSAEARHRLPAGLLFAISKVKSGRFDPAEHQLEPWPWTVQAEGRGLFFESKSQAVQWVEDAMARGVTSIDTGCLQVNLFYHPHAFATLEDAFDPAHNADYAARFLLQLHASAGDWREAAGFYHSQTLALATSYRDRVGRALGGETPTWPAAPKPPTILDRLGDAWGATLVDHAAAPANPVTPGPVMNDWGVLLHMRGKLSSQSRPRPPRRYAGSTFLLFNAGRPQ